MNARTSRQKPRLWGWGDEVFKSIIEKSISRIHGNIYSMTDISSPPGTKKTYSVLSYAIENRSAMVASFPNHENQRTALNYLLDILEKEKPKRLKQFIVDYAGIENYCLFYNPERLMRLLDKFKQDEKENYIDAAQNMLGDPTIFQVLTAKDVYDVVENLWIRIAEALENYKVTKDKRAYIEKVKQVVEKRGQYEICTSVCPLGLMAWWHRKQLYKFFSEPKIITWRKLDAEKNEEYSLGQMKYVSRHVVQANPENFVDNIERLLKGEFKPEWVLCPRHLLLSKISMSPKSSRPTYIATRKSIILTPHAGLDFVLSVISRELELTGVKRRYILFLDEYDTLLKPKTWPVIPLDVVKAIRATAHTIRNLSEGDMYKGVLVDTYLKRYAEYVDDVLQRIIELVEKSIETKEYHPLANIFVEGAFSYMRETTIKTKVPIEYLPLGARVAHIKHYLRDSRLLQLILNPKLYFYDLAEEDKEWSVKYRETVSTFKFLIRTLKVLAKLPVSTAHFKYKKVLTLKVFEIPAFDALQYIRDYVKAILVAPRIALFYTHNPGRQFHHIKLASIDYQIYKLLTWAKTAIMTSATPVNWEALVLGTNLDYIASSDYERVTKDVFHSFILFEEPERYSYDIKEEVRYRGKLTVYDQDFIRKIRDSLISGAPVQYDPKGMIRTEMSVKQVSPVTVRVREYTKLLKVYTVGSFTPLQKSRVTTVTPRLYEEFIKSLEPYLTRIGNLYTRGDTILVLTQNKAIASFLSSALRATPCLGKNCGPNVKKLSHYLAKKRIFITWFRSRAGRGIDLPSEFNSVVVVGSPYPRPQTLVYYKSTGISQYVSRFSIFKHIQTYNDRVIHTVMKTLTAREFMNGISELVQAVGRATRSAMRTGERIDVFIPAFVLSKVYLFAPYWFRASARGTFT